MMTQFNYSKYKKIIRIRMPASVICYSAASYFEIEPSFFTSETIELISASVPLLSAITLILKGLLHSLPSFKELPSNTYKGTSYDLACSSSFNLFPDLRELESIISLEPFMDCNTSFVPHLYLLAFIASLSTFSIVFTNFFFHHHVELYHTCPYRYSSTYYNVFCYTPQCFNLSF